LLLLGIDTSTRKGILCLGGGRKIIATQVLSDRLFSEQIFPALDALIKKSKLKAQDIQAIVVSLGPGSFTGLRIGVSLAKSLAYALEIPLVGVSTLDALAFSAPLKGLICPLLEAYGNQYYAQFYQISEAKLTRLSEPLFLPLEKIIEEKENLTSNKVSFVIRDAEIIDKSKRAKQLPFVLSETSSLVNALLRLGEERIQEGRIETPSHLIPLYISSPKLIARETINIRQMRRADIPAVSEIESLSFPNPWPRSAFLEELKKRGFAFYWVIEFQHSFAGYAGYWRIGNEAHLVNFAIHPSFRRKGLGEKLLKFILQRIQDQRLNTVTLEVRQSNLAACRLYEKLGFKKVAILPHYYINEDAIVYWKKL